MTSAQQDTLDKLFNDYMEKKALYDIEVIDNYKAKNGQGGDPVASDASLAAKKLNMENALKAYNLLKEDIASREQASFIAANPNLAVDIAKTKAETSAKAELEKQNATFAAKNKQTILYAGIVLVVVVVGVFIYLKVKKAA